MKAQDNSETNTITLGEGIPLLESLYDDIRKPVFIVLISKMSTKLGTYKKQGDIYILTEETCQNLAVLAILNLN